MLVVCLYARAVLPDACSPAGVEKGVRARAKLLLECRQAPSLETGPANAEPWFPCRDGYSSQNALKASWSASTLENPSAEAAASRPLNWWARAETLLP